MFLVIDDAEIVVSVGVSAIGTDSMFKILPGFVIALHHELADADLIKKRRGGGPASQRGLVIIRGVEEIFHRAQIVTPLLQLLGRCRRRGWIHTVQRRRADLQLFTVLSLQWL